MKFTCLHVWQRAITTICALHGCHDSFTAQHIIFSNIYHSLCSSYVDFVSYKLPPATLLTPRCHAGKMRKIMKKRPTSTISIWHVIWSLTGLVHVKQQQAIRRRHPQPTWTMSKMLNLKFISTPNTNAYTHDITKTCALSLSFSLSLVRLHTRETGSGWILFQLVHQIKTNI